MGDSIFKDKEEEKKKGPVFNVTASHDADVEAELERRRRAQEEQRKWMENAPDQSAKKMEKTNKNKIHSNEEEAKKTLKKDYLKITEPVVPWEEANYPDMPKALQDLIKDILKDNSRMTKNHFGVLKDAVQNLAKAKSEELKEYYLNQVYAASRDYIKRSTTKTNKKRLERVVKLKDQILDYKRMRQSEQERIEKKNAGNDKDAKEIVRYREAIESLKSDTIRPYPENGSEKELDAYRKEISGMGMMFSMQYNKLISACEFYLSKRDKPVVARDHYQKMMKKAEAELKLFNNALTDFLRTSKKDKDITWGDAIDLRVNNMASVNTLKNKNVGAGTSNVYKIERGTSEFDYFKEEENIGKSMEDCWDIVFRRFLNAKPDNDQKKILTRLGEAIRNDIKEIEKEKDPVKRKRKESIFYDVFVRGNRNLLSKLTAGNTEAIDNLNEGKNYQTLTHLSVLSESVEVIRKFAGQLIKEFSKSYNSYVIATRSAKIKAGSNLSSRNVATYRLAVALGMEDNVARSETAQVSVNGKEVFGNLMQEAKGKPMAKEQRLTRDRQFYTSKCVCDLAAMHIFDIICGQVDRNSNNFFVDSNDEGLHQIMMIDNDMAFGNLEEDDYLYGIQALPAFTFFAIMALPENIKTRIKELDEKTLSLLLEDVLTAEEIETANKRLGFIKQQIDAVGKGQNKLKKSKDKDERFEAYCMQFEEYKALNYQLELLKVVKSQNQKLAELEAKDGKKRKALQVFDFSYLSTVNMMPEHAIIEKMKDFKKLHRKDNWDV